MTTVKAIINGILKFFAAVVGTNKGLLLPEELLRSILASLGSGSFVSLALTVVTTVLGSASVIFPNPLAGGLVTCLLALLADMLRRLDHGGPTPPAPVPVPTPVPAPKLFSGS